jgi:dienelactone hydrolase
VRRRQHRGSARNRVDDVTYVLDELLALRSKGAVPLGAAIDSVRAAIVGYSFGGWTASRAAPGDRFDATVIQAPGSADELLVEAPRTDIPVLLMGAGEDALIDPDDVRRLYERYPDDVPHYFVYLPKAIHSAFHDVCFEDACESALSRERGHELVNRYATAFLLAYLVGDERYLSYLQDSTLPDAQVEYVRP